jgi:N-carbamoyl-L-amino-acid hydrolase
MSGIDRLKAHLLETGQIGRTKPVRTERFGKLNVFPNGTNVVPGRVEMGIDIRDVDRGRMEELTQQTLDLIKTLEDRYDVKTKVELPAPHDPVPLSREVTAAIEASAGKMGISSRRMNSGAGHDSQNIAERVKTGMIFVPSVNGVSHSPLEWTEWEDIEKGMMVLTQTIKELSRI